MHGEELSDEEMDELARTTSPIIRLRDNWVAVDSAVIKRARKRLIRTVTPVQALAATLTGVVDIEDVHYEAVVGASLLTVRDQRAEAASGELVEVPAALQASLRDYQRQRADLAGRAHRRSASAPASPTTWGSARRSR